MTKKKKKKKKKKSGTFAVANRDDSENSTIELVQRRGPTVSPPDKSGATDLGFAVTNPIDAELAPRPTETQPHPTSGSNSTMNTLPRISDWMDEHETTPLVPRLTSKIQAVAFITACACAVAWPLVLAPARAASRRACTCAIAWPPAPAPA